MPCCCCCCCNASKWEGEPVMLVLLELVDMPASGIPADKCWIEDPETWCCWWWAPPNCSAFSNADGKSRSLCIWMPSPGPIWLMWLKFDGAEIIFDRRSLFLWGKKNFYNLSAEGNKMDVLYAGFEARLFSRTEKRRRVLGWLLVARLCPPKVTSLSATLTASQTANKHAMQVDWF